MLSALIQTEGGYSAMPLAGQSIHQSFVIPGPLVMCNSLISKCIDYIFTLWSVFVKRNEFGVGVGVLWKFKFKILYLPSLPVWDQSLRGQTKYLFHPRAGLTLGGLIITFLDSDDARPNLSAIFDRQFSQPFIC